MTKLSRDQAKAAGLPRYSTGEPCVQGHVVERFVSSRGCVVCSMERAAQWKRDHPEKCAETRRAWVAANPEHNQAIKAAWNKANPEGQAKRSRAWFLANKERANSHASAYRKRTPDKQNAKAAARRAALLRATPLWADDSITQSLYTLASIYRDFGHDVEVDHIVPLKGRNVCGLHIHHNLQVIPTAENRSKANRFHS